MTGYARIDRGSYYQWARQKGLSKDATSMGMYLLCGSESTQHGLYHLTLPTACHYLQLAEAEALEALGDLAEAPCKPLASPLQAPSKGCDWFAKYDPASSWVWIRNAVRYQVSAEPMKATDNRAKGGCKWYAGLPNSPFLGAFFDHWGEHLCLNVRREGKPLASPLGNPSKPLRSQEQEQEQEQEQDQEQEDTRYPDLAVGDPQGQLLPPGDVEGPLPPPVPPGPSTARQVEAVWAHYRTHHRRCLVQPGPKDAQKILARLKEGHDVAKICESIDGFHRSDHHVQGGHLGIVTILRDSGQIDHGLRLLAKAGRVRLSDQNQRNLAAAAEWVEMEEAKQRDNDDDDGEDQPDD